MCGHATIALGRFLVDTHDLSIFPHRDKLPHDEATGVTTLRLHAPCGVVHVSVHTDDGHSDATRPVSFLGVPSFVTARDLEVDIPPSVQWKRLRDAQRSRVKVDIAYGGAFYALVSAPPSSASPPACAATCGTLAEFDEAAAALEADIGSADGAVRAPERARLGVPLQRDGGGGDVARGRNRALLLWRTRKSTSRRRGRVSWRVWRSPLTKGGLQIGEGRKYESIVSVLHDGNGFRGTAVERGPEGVIVKVEGGAFYTGAASFVVEEHDMMPDGFTLALPS
ncbi:hypothetical protein B0H14DRAFT_2850526 [Mycena olivaceomarginata]|nr:hypothetical protein B0H14DRAFT_2850526 [Mycena olivaceomarginata]